MEMPEATGLTGEISYVSDDTAQVQDDSSQTAVSWTDDTTITAEVEIALADIETGACVVVTLADDETTASTVSVTEADDDGSCATGFGGGMGGATMEDGDMPTDMPTDMAQGEMPDDAEMPTDMPTDMAQGEMPDGGDFDTSSIVTGAVTAVGDDTLTIETTDGDETTVDIDADSALTGTEEADADAIEVGMCMTATGESDSSGGYAATSISVFSAGDDGCISTTGFGGGMGGQMPGGDGTTDESGE